MIRGIFSIPKASDGTYGRLAFKVYFRRFQHLPFIFISFLPISGVNGFNQNYKNSSISVFSPDLTFSLCVDLVVLCSKVDLYGKCFKMHIKAT